MVKGYIFDYGGTLDTGGNHWGKVIWHAYERVGVPVSEALFRDAYVHGERTLGRNPIIKPDFTFRQTLAQKLRLQLDFIEAASPEVSWAKHGEMLLNDLYTRTCEETSQSRSVLLQLREHFPMVLVSNFYGNIATVLREFSLDGIFQHIVESAVVGIRKPDPRIFTLGVEALGLDPSEVVVVGDSIDKDIIPARQSGCHTVWFKGEGWTDAPVDESQAERVINSLSELVEER
jgi:putative hydrolase of the HAD superfamily